jgi:exosortase K
MTSRVRENAPALAVAAMAVILAKLAYAHLGYDRLLWIAGPTQSIVSLLTGIEFTPEAGYGYVSLAHRIVIAKACLGVNYLVMVFGLLTWTLVPTARRGWKLPMLLPIAAAAWASTLLVNGVRIAVGIELHDAGFEWGWLTPERVHRVAGVLIYLPALIGIEALARRVGRRDFDAERGLGIVATSVACYGCVALGLPLANGALVARPRLFLEHAAMVAGLALLLGAALQAVFVAQRRRRVTGATRSVV